MVLSDLDGGVGSLVPRIPGGFLSRVVELVGGFGQILKWDCWIWPFGARMVYVFVRLRDSVWYVHRLGNIERFSFSCGE